MLAHAAAVFVLLGTFLGPDAGDIWVRAAPGVIVVLDQKERGVTTEEEAGIRLTGVAAGRHHLQLLLPGGGSKTVKVDVRRQETTVVTVPALGVRERIHRFGAIEVFLDPPMDGCIASVGRWRYALSSSGRTRIDEVLPGAQRVTIACGERSFGVDATIPADTAVHIAVDPVANTAAVSGQRPRVTDIVVRTTHDKILDAPISGAAKRALFAASVPGVRLQSVAGDWHGRASVVYEANTCFDVADIYFNLRKIIGVSILSFSVTKRDGWCEMWLLVEAEDRQ